MEAGRQSSKIIRFLRHYNSGTQKLVKIPFINILLNILELLDLHKLISRGLNEVQGVGKFPKINKRLLGTKEYAMDNVAQGTLDAF